MPKEMTWPESINKVLNDAGKPLHYNDITEIIIKSGYRKSIGATPSATVNAQITYSIKHDPESPYLKVEPGVFTLKKLESSRVDEISTIYTSNDQTTELDEQQYQVITCFGMYWRREEIEWNKKPRILGQQQQGAQPVDFYSQSGIYILYDDSRVIYVGRAAKNNLGIRLLDHTKDRHASRWNRFSWFGLNPIDENGKINEMPKDYSSEVLIPALEAMLIEALEPPQNRKRGDDLETVEYIQTIDPNIEKKRFKIYMEKLIERD